MAKSEQNHLVEKISVTLTAEMMRIIRESVAAGEFASTSEALRDAVRLWQQAREERAERLTAIKARLEKSINDPRPSFTMEQVRANLRKLHKKAQKDSADED